MHCMRRRIWTVKKVNRPGIEAVRLQGARALPCWHTPWPHCTRGCSGPPPHPGTSLGGCLGSRCRAPLRGSNKFHISEYTNPRSSSLTNYFKKITSFHKAFLFKKQNKTKNNQTKITNLFPRLG